MSENKQIARRMSEEVYGAGEIDLLDEYCAEGYVNHDPIGGDMGIEEEKALVQNYRDAFPDLSVEAFRVFEEGDYVCVQWRAQGTHTGELMGVPPTGHFSKIEGTAVSRIENGKITESWQSFDTLKLMRNIGVIPTVGEEPRPSA